jgi:hypothetical protein
MLIEITEQAQIADRLLSFLGIDEAVRLEIGHDRIRGEFEAGRSKEDKLSAVQYVRFAVPPAARRAFAEPQVPVRLVIDHPRYREEAVLGGAVRESLSADLGEPS